MGETSQSFRQNDTSYPADPILRLRSNLQPWLKAIVFTHYWKIILSIGVFVLMLETVEHLPAIINKKPFYYGEVFLIMLLLAITGLLLRRLAHNVRERTEAIKILRVKKDISQQLASAYNMKDVSDQLVQEVSALIPLMGVELYLYGTPNNRLCQTACANIAHPVDRAAELPPGNDPCQACFLQNKASRYAVTDCTQLHCPIFARDTLNGGSRDYCLQLSHGKWLLGVLHLSQPDGGGLPEGQVKLLESIASDISIALEIAVRRIQRDELALAQKVNSVQLEIARDLHDTIGQNISYLRMKLEHLAESKMSSAVSTDISAEIAHMSAVANESYDLVRGTLAMLQPNRTAHLHELFQGHAQQVMDRTNLEIIIKCSGEPRPITTKQMRQLFYVFREALNNVEKHANAQQVRVDTNWLKHEMTLIISDDGCGFDPVRALPGNHYGLKFMRDRIEQLNGNFNIWSSPGKGACLTVCFPYEEEIPFLPAYEPVHKPE